MQHFTKYDFLFPQQWDLNQSGFVAPFDAAHLHSYHTFSLMDFFTALREVRWESSQSLREDFPSPDAVGGCLQTDLL